MLQDDFIMRMIHEMVTTLLKLIFHIELGENEVENFKDQGTASDYLELLALSRPVRLMRQRINYWMGWIPTIWSILKWRSCFIII